MGFVRELEAEGSRQVTLQTSRAHNHSQFEMATMKVTSQMVKVMTKRVMKSECKSMVEEYKCSISRKLPIDPVMASDVSQERSYVM